MANTIKATPVADEFQQAWNYGWLGEPCPEPPADLDYWQVDGWLAAHQAGREAVAEQRRREATAKEAYYQGRAHLVSAEQREQDQRSLESVRETANKAEALAAQGR